MLTEHSENLTIAHPEWPMRGSDRRWRKPRWAMESEGLVRGAPVGTVELTAATTAAMAAAATLAA